MVRAEAFSNTETERDRWAERTEEYVYKNFKLPVFLVHLVIFGGDLWAHHAARCRRHFQTHSLSVFLLLTTARFPPKVLGWYSVILKYIRINIL